MPLLLVWSLAAWRSCLRLGRPVLAQQSNAQRVVLWAGPDGGDDSAALRCPRGGRPHRAPHRDHDAAHALTACGPDEDRQGRPRGACLSPLCSLAAPNDALDEEPRKLRQHARQHLRLQGTLDVRGHHAHRRYPADRLGHLRLHIHQRGRPPSPPPPPRPLLYRCCRTHAVFGCSCVAGGSDVVW